MSARALSLMTALLMLVACGTPLADETLAPGGTPAPDGLLKGDSNQCMRCHRMPTLAYRDQDTGEIVDLSIRADAYRRSVHAGLGCLDCHDRGYRRYPHRTTSADEELDCVGCHEDKGEADAPALGVIDTEFQRSIHAVEEPDGFSCFSCHDPHGFRPVGEGAPVREVIDANNRVCLGCHPELDLDPPLGHDWLPHPRVHWRAVRCVDCHTPVNGQDGAHPSHQVLAAAESARNCVECHHKDSTLLSQLYAYRAGEEERQHGWLAKALYNDAYIVGMSRNDTLDRISLAVIALVLAGIAAHGTGRYIAFRKRARDNRDGL